MSTLDTAGFTALLKTRFPNYKVKRAVYRVSPVNSMFERDETFTGEDMKIPVIIEGAVGYSSDFKVAQRVADPTKQEAWRLTRKRFFGVNKIDTEVLNASKDKNGAFMSASSSQLEGILYSLGRQMTLDIYGDGKGYLATIKTGTTLASTTAILNNANDVIWFQRGQTYGLVDVTAGGGAGADRGGTALICASVNRKLGTVTFTANISSIAGAAIGDAFVVEGTFNLRWQGFRAWLVDNPSATLFFNVDRSKDPTRLAGQILDAAGANAPTTIFDLIQENTKTIYREGGRPNVVLLSPTQQQKLLNELKAKDVNVKMVEVGIDTILRAEMTARAMAGKTDEMDSNADFGDGKNIKLSEAMPGFEAAAGHYAVLGYSGVIIETQCGRLVVYSDPSCPDTDIFVLQSDTWKVCTLKAAPHVFDDDDLWVRAAPNDPALELRVQYFGNLACTCPGFNGRIINVPVN